MFDGKRFFPDTGIPIRKIAFLMRSFALDEPVPFTDAILKAKSFTRLGASVALSARGGSYARVIALPPGRFAPVAFRPDQDQRRESTDRTSSCPTPRSDSARRTGRSECRY